MGIFPCIGKVSLSATFVMSDGVSIQLDACSKCWSRLYNCFYIGFCNTILDEDGDLIAFSTGEELLEALGFVDNGLFRVFIRPSKLIRLIITCQKIVKKKTSF